MENLYVDLGALKRVKYDKSRIPKILPFGIENYARLILAVTNRNDGKDNCKD